MQWLRQTIAAVAVAGAMLLGVCAIFALRIVLYAAGHGDQPVFREIMRFLG
jgi:hypothetical protein